METARSTASRNSLLRAQLTYPRIRAAGSQTKPASTVKKPAMKLPEAKGIHTKLVSGDTAENTPK